MIIRTLKNIGHCILICFPLILSSQNFQNTSEFEWILGNWKTTDSKTIFAENWQKINDTLFLGIGLVISKKDTVSYEDLSLTVRAKGVYYSAKVKNQNKGKTVDFKLTYFDPEKIIFENPEHDFPTKITYIKKNKDNIEAVVEGKSAKRKFVLIFHKQ